MLASIMVPVGGNIFVIFGLGCGIWNPIISIRIVLNDLSRLSSKWSIVSYNVLVPVPASDSLLFVWSVLFWTIALTQIFLASVHHQWWLPAIILISAPFSTSVLMNRFISFVIPLPFLPNQVNPAGSGWDPPTMLAQIFVTTSRIRQRVKLLNVPLFAWPLHLNFVI